MVREREGAKAGCNAQFESEQGRGCVSENLRDEIECVLGSSFKGLGLHLETLFAHAWDTAIGEVDDMLTK